MRFIKTASEFLSELIRQSDQKPPMTDSCDLLSRDLIPFNISPSESFNNYKEITMLRNEHISIKNGDMVSNDAAVSVQAMKKKC